MQSHHIKPVSFFTCAFCGMWVFWFANAVWGQNTISQRHIEIHTHGGTPLSYQIQAEAAYVSSYGDAVKSISEARAINAQAVEQEIKNNSFAIEEWFRMRELNREEWRKANPNAMVVEEKHQKVLKEKVQKQYQDLLRGDVTKPLNWLLRELSSPVVACQYLPIEESLANSKFDLKLSNHDLEQIVLTDGGPKKSRLIFHAGDGETLKTRWPQGMAPPEFDQAKEDFEKARIDLIAEIKANNQISHPTQQNIFKSVDALLVTLENYYPPENRKDPKVFSTYARAKTFTSNLLAQVQRACTSSNTAYVLDRNLRFEGDSVVALLQHMYKNGLEFAPPEEGGESTYKTLFQSMRTLYLNVGQPQNNNVQ